MKVSALRGLQLFQKENCSRTFWSANSTSYMKRCSRRLLVYFLFRIENFIVAPRPLSSCERISFFPEYFLSLAHPRQPKHVRRHWYLPKKSSYCTLRPPLDSTTSNQLSLFCFKTSPEDFRTDWTLLLSSGL